MIWERFAASIVGRIVDALYRVNGAPPVRVSNGTLRMMLEAERTRRFVHVTTTRTADRTCSRARTATRPRSISRPRPRGAGRPRARGASRGDPEEPEPPRWWLPARSSDQLLRDVSDYLGRLGGWGAERGWLVDQISFLGYPAERVGVALALAVSNGQARRGVGQDDSDVVWGRS